MPREVAEIRDIGRFPQPREREAAIAELAWLQHGVVGRGQLLALGLGPDAIQHRIGVGRLLRVHAGVYAVGHLSHTQRSRWMAAVLACSPGGVLEWPGCGDGNSPPGTPVVLSHRSAAALWGIRRHGGAVELTVPGKRGAPRPIRLHASQLPADEITLVDGIPVTTVPRTILDLAAVSRPEVVESALRQAEYLRLDDRLSLPDLLKRYPGRRGIRSIRAALARHAESPGRLRSPLEERFVPFLDRHGLPRPHLNAWVEAAEKRYEVDCLWPSQRQIVELDGWEGHGTRSAFRDDRGRDRRLRVAGYGVTRLTWSQLDDEPEAIAHDLRHLLAA